MDSVRIRNNRLALLFFIIGAGLIIWNVGWPGFHGGIARVPWPESDRFRPRTNGGSLHQWQARSQSITDKLNKPVVAVHMSAIPLEECLQHIAQAHAMRIEVDWASLRQAGILRDDPVTVRLVDCNTGLALHQILESVDEKLTRIRCVISGETVLITTINATGKKGKP